MFRLAHLVAPHGPAFHLLPREQFQEWTWTNLLNQFSEFFWLFAVLTSADFQPTPLPEGKRSGTRGSMDLLRPERERLESGERALVGNSRTVF
jgi:hypothetical protein